MRAQGVAALTREDITAAAKRLRASRPAKWTVISRGGSCLRDRSYWRLRECHRTIPQILIRPSRS